MLLVEMRTESLHPCDEKRRMLTAQADDLGAWAIDLSSGTRFLYKA